MPLLSRLINVLKVLIKVTVGNIHAIFIAKGGVPSRATSALRKPFPTQMNELKIAAFRGSLKKLWTKTIRLKFCMP
jgi:hypothetical protein